MKKIHARHAWQMEWCTACSKSRADALDDDFCHGIDVTRLRCHG